MKCYVFVCLLCQLSQFCTATTLAEARSADSFLGHQKSRDIAGLLTIRSTGCGKASPLGISEFQVLHGGLMRTFRTLTPHDYTPDSPRSVIIGFHGHGMSPDEIVNGPMAHLASEPNGPLIVAPYGVYAAGLPASFNGAGSTGSPGPDGPTCTKGAREWACHWQTCGHCKRCWWTSCADDVGYVLSVLDQVEASFCVRSDQIYATGFSGGGQFTFEIATNPRSAHRFEAVAPLSGLPHNGFLQAPHPLIAPRLLGIWEGVDAKFQDPIYPPISNIEGRPDKSMDIEYGPNGGFYYSTADNTTRLWAQALCSSSVDNAAKQVAGEAQSFHSELSCEGWCGGQLIKCMRATDKHDWASYQPKLLWEFFRGHGIFKRGFVAAQKRRRNEAFVSQGSAPIRSHDAHV